MAKKGLLTKTHPLDWEVAMNLLRDLKDLRSSALFHIGFFTSLRIGDIIKLKWEDILNEDLLVLNETKTKKNRSINIHPELARAIDDYYQFSNQPDTRNYIFKPLRGTLIKNKPISTHGANKLIKKVLSVHKIDCKLNDSSHLLRKTWARRAFELLGANEEALIYLSELLNHSKVTVTRKYIGIDDELFEDLYLNINNKNKWDQRKDGNQALSKRKEIQEQSPLRISYQRNVG